MPGASVVVRTDSVVEEIPITRVAREIAIVDHAPYATSLVSIGDVIVVSEDDGSEECELRRVILESEYSVFGCVFLASEADAVISWFSDIERRGAIVAKNPEGWFSIACPGALFTDVKTGLEASENGGLLNMTCLVDRSSQKVATPESEEDRQNAVHYVRRVAA